MKQECKYIEELKRQQKIMIGILIVICIIFLLDKIVPWNFILGLFKDNNGNFSNDILWNAIGAIGGIAAFFGVIITIICTEDSRIKQNKYDYIKNQKELEFSQFKSEVKHQLEILNPTNAVEISLNILNEYNYRDICIQLSLYLCRIRRVLWNINWFYDNNVINDTKKYREFVDIACIEIEKITQIINSYTDCVNNWFLNRKIYLNLIKEIEKNNALKQDEKEQLDKLRPKYESENKQEEFVKTILSYKMELVELSNNRMPILERKAKDMIEERDNFIKNELKI